MANFIHSSKVFRMEDINKNVPVMVQAYTVSSGKIS